MKLLFPFLFLVLLGCNNPPINQQNPTLRTEKQNSCGPSALSQFLAKQDLKIHPEDVYALLAKENDTIVSMADLAEAAEKAGFTARPVILIPKAARELDCYAIAYLPLRDMSRNTLGYSPGHFILVHLVKNTLYSIDTDGNEKEIDFEKTFHEDYALVLILS